MSKYVKKTGVKKAGLSPGTLVHVGNRKVERAKITIIDYDEKQVEEREAKSIEECFSYKEKPTVTWINIDGIHDLDIVEKLGRHYDLHALVMEDIVHTDQRPKIEDFEDYIFLVLKMLYYDEKVREVKTEQVSIILGSNFAISLQEQEGDVFDPVRKRIRDERGRIRKRGADYLAYTLIDAIVDNYFIILEKIGEDIEGIEEKLITTPKTETLQNLHRLKREIIMLRKAIWPLRDVASRLERGESPLIKESTRIFLRDVYDHTIRVIETIETFRDMVSGMLDLYLSSISNRMNDVMKVLTIIATIFIPLTFIAGIYGMNFEFMPELKWHWGYPFVWFLMIVISIFMIGFFKRKKWL